MVIFCPRCGAQNDDEMRNCIDCRFSLIEVAAIVKGGGESRYWLRFGITLLIFIGAPMLLLTIGRKLNKEYYEILAGLLLVLLLPGLPWIISAIFNRATKLR